mmetsp:Transcript_14127/g.27897  ORF Transcript_14127/g.27897 Transcript_14127/m.27897 type:complete len:296 (+) Transcript_14127:225-1112(+)|eukprot:CAMPEP_0173415372 /NCGR_PEP_ID=MMETSP1356-20130122/84825_1 /TAXON_ID=77927 ORGANISM="Hemiselmis virescens, Strain PCC157" /NCGR_SAMPLE_ID=MMETSP1356 /ASSEMBLY_ACC=CAM_ASM_000847 /LENGTH=295 /DNA_ID=CAMNT_0014377615 /DNA_START=222 /DNA_END=1109 /DNA_ORIENTATION=-
MQGPFGFKLMAFFLVLSGLGCFGGCYFAQNVIDQSFTTACLGAAEAADCLDNLATNGTNPDANAAPVYSDQECRVDIKEKLGCVCLDRTLAGCDCNGSLFYYVENYWTVGCISAGGAAAFICIFMTGIPAWMIAKKKRKYCNIYVYCFTCAFFFLPFLAFGGFFTTAAIVIRDPTKIGLNMSDCEGSVTSNLEAGAAVAASKAPSSTGDAERDAQIAEAAAAAKLCGAKAFCAGIKGLSGEMLYTATRIGVPFALAGLTMLCGAFSCIFCRKGLPQAEKPKPKIPGGKVVPTPLD